jgi:hypothetical protein
MQIYLGVSAERFSRVGLEVDDIVPVGGNGVFEKILVPVAVFRCIPGVLRQVWDQEVIVDDDADGIRVVQLVGEGFDPDPGGEVSACAERDGLIYPKTAAGHDDVARWAGWEPIVQVFRGNLVAIGSYPAIEALVEVRVDERTGGRRGG